jgi:hypothetical protein
MVYLLCCILSLVVVVVVVGGQQGEGEVCCISIGSREEYVPRLLIALVDRLVHTRGFFLLTLKRFLT